MEEFSDKLGKEMKLLSSIGIVAVGSLHEELCETRAPSE